MNVGLFILRAVVGLTFAAHGAQKLFGWFGGEGIAGTGAIFESYLGFRPGKLHATVAGLVEFGGGLLFALGLFVPFAAAGIVAGMLVAGWSAHRDKGFFVSKGGWEYTFILAAVAVGVASTGPGAWSLDAALGLPLAGWAWGLAALVAGLVGGAGNLAMRTAPAPAAAPKA
jgi:putative oxidoreductase